MQVKAHTVLFAAQVASSKIFFTAIYFSKKERERAYERRVVLRGKCGKKVAKIQERERAALHDIRWELRRAACPSTLCASFAAKGSAIVSLTAMPFTSSISAAGRAR